MMNQSIARLSKPAPRLGLPHVLTVGYGDVRQRCPTLLRTRFRVFAVTSRLEGRATLHETGAMPIVANLGGTVSLYHPRELSPHVLHLAPPPAVGSDNPRAIALLHTLTQPPPDPTATKHRILSERARKTGSLTGRLKTPLQACAFVYTSTSGVYDDAGGAWIDESRPVKPRTARAQRRVAAERRVCWFGAGGTWRTSILRIPGIYAADRLPVARLERGTPVLCTQDDIYTNHIHADDPTRVVITVLSRERPQRIVYATDASELRMGGYFDAAADAHGLQRPPRISRVGALQQIEPALLSFMSESRRPHNTRSARELRVVLRCPTMADFLSDEV